MDRRRIRRIEADRPTTDVWDVRESMRLFVLSLPRLGAVWALAVGHVARRGWGDRALFSASGRGSQSYLVGRCSDLLSLLGVHLDVPRMRFVPPACQLSPARHDADKAPFGPLRTAKVTRHSQRATSPRPTTKPGSRTRIRFKSHNLVTIAPWLRSPDRAWQTRQLKRAAARRCVCRALEAPRGKRAAQPGVSLFVQEA